MCHDITLLVVYLDIVSIYIIREIIIIYITIFNIVKELDSNHVDMLD